MTTATDHNTPQTLGQIATFNTQEAFLRAFAGAGTVLSAAETARVDRGTVYRWLDGDVYEFRRRLELAKDNFADKVENVLFHEVFSEKPNPLLVIFTNKAHNRAKYGDSITVTNDRAAELLSAVRGLPSGSAAVVEIVAVEEDVRRAIER